MQKMGKNAQGAGLPKRKVIERMVARQSECTPALIAMLECFRQYSFSEEQCMRQMSMLTECVKRQEVSYSLIFLSLVVLLLLFLFLRFALDHDGAFLICTEIRLVRAEGRTNHEMFSSMSCLSLATLHRSLFNRKHRNRRARSCTI